MALITNFTLISPFSSTCFTLYSTDSNAEHLCYTPQYAPTERIHSFLIFLYYTTAINLYRLSFTVVWIGQITTKKYIRNYVRDSSFSLSLLFAIE